MPLLSAIYALLSILTRWKSQVRILYAPPRLSSLSEVHEVRFRVRFSAQPWWLLAGALPACSPLPGDGRLVLVHVSQDFTPEQAAAVANGARYWDAVGARLRTDAAGQPVAGELTFEPSGIDLASDAWFDVATHTIRFDPCRLRKLTMLQIACLTAHEAGHALGLGHHDGAGIMRAKADQRYDLSEDDVAAFREVWPR